MLFYCVFSEGPDRSGTRAIGFQRLDFTAFGQWTLNRIFRIWMFLLDIGFALMTLQRCDFMGVEEIEHRMEFG